MGTAILLFAGLAALVWPRAGGTELPHRHDPVDHGHLHTHGPHHQHEHRGEEGPEPHVHAHHHHAIEHEHEFYIDDHHMHWPKA